MKQHIDRNGKLSAPRARRWITAIALVGTVIAAGSTFAGGMSGGDGFDGFGGMFGHHGRHGGGQGERAAMDPARMDKHIDRLVEHILPDGSADQKTRLAAIAKAAMADLHPLRAQLRQNHAKARALLTAAVIDRAALEQLRAEQLHQMDAISKRALTAIEDAAEVLTPAQRAKFGEQLQRRMR